MEIEQKAAICKTCEERSSLNFCNKCGCFIPLKIIPKGATCPLNKWVIEENPATPGIMSSMMILNPTKVNILP